MVDAGLDAVRESVCIGDTTNEAQWNFGLAHWKYPHPRRQRASSFEVASPTCGRHGSCSIATEVRN